MGKSSLYILSQVLVLALFSIYNVNGDQCGYSYNPSDPQQDLPLTLTLSHFEKYQSNGVSMDLNYQWPSSDDADEYSNTTIMLFNLGHEQTPNPTNPAKQHSNEDCRGISGGTYGSVYMSMYWLPKSPKTYYFLVYAYSGNSYQYKVLPYNTPYTPGWVYAVAFGVPFGLWFLIAIGSLWRARRVYKNADRIPPHDQKSGMDLFLLWLPPAGILGLHHFYLRRPAFGALYLFTFGGLGVGWLVDAWRLPWLLIDLNTGTQPLPSGTWQKTTFDAYMMWFPFGIIGMHHFYLGRPLFGFLYVVTLGLFGLGWIFDGFRMRRLVKDARERYERQHSVFAETTPLPASYPVQNYGYTQAPSHAVPAGHQPYAAYHSAQPAGSYAAPPLQSGGSVGSYPTIASAPPAAGPNPNPENTAGSSTAGASTSGRELCCICMTNAVNTVVLECHHSVMCLKCAKELLDAKISECPVCRQEIKEVMEIYR